MEKVSYEEAREWFWVRTWLWFLVAALVSVMATFGYSTNLVKVLSTRLWISLVVGIAMPLMGMTAGALSLQFPWMRLGWRRGFLLNGPVCTVISAVLVFFVCGIVLSLMQNDAVHPASVALIQTTYAVMQFSMVGGALWGFFYGSWFALRRDKYFVEPI